MKFLNVLFFFSLGLNVYFLTKKEDKIIVDTYQDEVSLTDSAPRRVKTQIRKPLISKREFQNKKVKNVEPNRYYETQANERLEFQEKEEIPTLNPEKQAKIEANWFNEVQEYFEYELNLSPDQVGEYQKLAVDRRVEIENYIGSLIKARGGVDHYLALTMDEMMEIADINKAYSNRLSQALGAEDYRAYQNLKREYNSALSGKADAEQYYVDF